MTVSSQAEMPGCFLPLGNLQNPPEHGILKAKEDNT